MATTNTDTPQRAVRADVKRNRAKLLSAARDAFTEDGSGASLEDIARRAGVGIGTLYRHFPTRTHLVEAAYVEEVEAMAREAGELSAQHEPWEALVAWLHRFMSYAVTKRALLEALNEEPGDSDVLQHCRSLLRDAGQPLVDRAREAGEIREDVDFMDVGRLVSGIAHIKSEPEEIDRIFRLALDGLRYRPA